MSVGAKPWQQTSWDWRAAANFVCGGAGSGLIVVTAASGASGTAAALLLVAGLALIGVGLLCVWAELGRPLRAFNVFLNPRTSWMTRESVAASLLLPVGAAAALGLHAGFAAAAWPAAALALAFVYCQSRMLQAARGIVAWRQNSTAPLLVATALAEGAGLFWLTGPLHDLGTASMAWLLLVLLAARAGLWGLWRRRLGEAVAPRAGAALDRAGGTLLIAGTLLPFVLLPLALAMGGTAGAALGAAAGLAAAGAGSALKFTLVTRAGYNQGFALPRLPVRGQPPEHLARREAAPRQAVPMPAPLAHER